MYRLLIIFFLFFGKAAFAQVPFFKEVMLNDSGIPVSVNDIAIQDNGMLWLATDNGVYRFNGRYFTQIKDSIHHIARCIAVQGAALYVGYNDGSVARVENNSLSFLQFRNLPPTAAVTSLHPVCPGVLLITTEDGLFLTMLNSSIPLNNNNELGDNFTYNAVLRHQTLITATDHGINIIDHAGDFSVRTLTTSEGLPDNIVRVLKPASGNVFWLGTQQGGITLYDHRSRLIDTSFFTGNWKWGQINDILPVHAKEAWVGTEDGYLLHVYGDHDTAVISPFYYEGRKIRKIVTDAAGNIWCATNRGLLMNSALYASDIPVRNHYALSSVNCIAFDKGCLLYALNKQVFQFCMKDSAGPRLLFTAPAEVTCLYPSAHNGLWVGTLGRGVFYYNGSKLREIKSIPGLWNGSVLSITAAGNYLWIASLSGIDEAMIDTLGGLSLYRHMNKASGAGSDYIYQLYTDRNAHIWMATDGGGITMYDGERFHRWDPSSGFPSQVVYSITEDASGNIWAGTLDKGLFRFDGKSWQPIGTAYGLQDLGISAVCANRSGEVMVVNQKGIDQWNAQSGLFRHFNRRLGVDIDSVSSVLNCITGDQQGNVYVPFEHGFIQFKNIDTAYDLRPGVQITNVKLFLRSLSEERHTFGYDEHHLSFYFEGINYTNPERLHYRYKLQGYDDNWVSTSDETVSFVQLPPGHYTFRVQASLSSHFMNAREDTFSFTITRPFWIQPWFLLIVITAVFGLIYLYIRIREQHLRNTSRLQKERMMFEYEHLKSQVNPHFLFNSLNTLVSLIEDDQHAAVQYTTQLSDLYRSMLAYKDRDLILLSEEYAIINTYMFIQQSRFGAALRLDTNIAMEVMETKRIVPLALQIIIENAVKHNIVSVSAPLVIHVRAENDMLIISNRLQPKLSKEKGAGLGLINIQKRYQLLTDKNISFGMIGDDYVVKLPLL